MNHALRRLRDRYESIPRASWHLKKRIGAVFVVVLAASCMFVFSPVDAEAQIIVVPDDFTTISAAVEHAGEGDTVYVKSGRYEINETLRINKTVSLIGEDAATTLLVGPGVTGWLFSPKVTIEVKADNFKISQVTINNCDVSISVSGKGTEVSNTIMSRSDVSGSHSVISNNSITGLLTVSGSYNTISGNNLAVGLEFNGSFCSITENTMDFDIYLQGVSNTIKGNTFPTMFLDYADSNIISNNSFTCLWVGYKGRACSNNTVFGNIAKGPYIWGILMGTGSQNVFHDNYITDYIGDYDGYGISIGGTHLVAENNIFYHNTLVNNSKSVGYNWELEGKGNSWDNGKEGNYWSDYNGTDANGDGIGDTPYIIDEKNIDRYPLMAQLITPSPLPSSPPTSSEPQGDMEPFLTPIIAVLSATSLAIIGIGLFLYFKRTRSQKHE
jgi:nitrous oxidase accessory protein NosD